MNLEQIKKHFNLGQSSANDKENKENSPPKESLETLLLKKKITQLTYQKVISAKKYIERKYNMIKYKNLETPIIMEKINSSHLPQEKKDEIVYQIKAIEMQNRQKVREHLTIFDFEPLKKIGQGSFGSVYICRYRKTNEIVAVKRLSKENITQRNQIRQTKGEQDFLAKIKSEWVVELKYSFQQGEFLYLIMDFLGGGDLMQLFMLKNKLTEDESRFYVAEIILAIEDLHNSGCIHRDMKPDNILIGRNGHIKLTDFGLSQIPEHYFKEDIKIVKNRQMIKEEKEIKKEEEKKGHKREQSCVGTVYYVAPEVIEKKRYTKAIDLWAVGVMFYEMLFGYVPFYDNENSLIFKRIMNHEKYLVFPADNPISKEAKNLICGLLSEPEKRLTIDQVKIHPFFRGFNWKKIKEINPPFIPQLKNAYDTSYFDSFEEKGSFYPNTSLIQKPKQSEFIGYTYKGEAEEMNLINVLEMIENEEREYKRKQELLEAQKRVEKERLMTLQNHTDFNADKEEFPSDIFSNKINNINKCSNSSMGNSSTKENEIEDDKKYKRQTMDLTAPINVHQNNKENKEKGIGKKINAYNSTNTEYIEKRNIKRINRDDIKGKKDSGNDKEKEKEKEGKINDKKKKDGKGLISPISIFKNLIKGKKK